MHNDRGSRARGMDGWVVVRLAFNWDFRDSRHISCERREHTVNLSENCLQYSPSSNSSIFTSPLSPSPPCHISNGGAAVVFPCHHVRYVNHDVIRSDKQAFEGVRTSNTLAPPEIEAPRPPIHVRSSTALFCWPGCLFVHIHLM